MGKDVCKGYLLSEVNQMLTHFGHYLRNIRLFLIFSIEMPRANTFFYIRLVNIPSHICETLYLELFLATYIWKQHTIIIWSPWTTNVLGQGRLHTLLHTWQIFRLSNGIPLFTKNFLTVFLQTNGKNFACRPFSKCILGRQSIIRY